ncbi:MAG: hypothetical protein MJ252_05570 [archaeon]|nr:hypothetical protein [archaeon]
MLCLLFTLSVAILALIAAGYKRIEQYMGCNSEFPRIFKPWSTLDKYLIELDKTMCSIDCECKIDYENAYQLSSKPYNKKYSSSLYVGDNPEQMYFDSIGIVMRDGGVEKVKDCHNYDKISEDYDNSPNIFFKSGKFKYKKFRKYWAYIEKKFDCVGSCNTNYEKIIDAETGETKQTRMTKYLFRGVHKGVPKYNGCIMRVMKWLKRMLISYGVFALLSAVIEIILFVFALGTMKKIAQMMQQMPQQQQGTEAANA